MKPESYANVSILAVAYAFAFASMPLLIFTASLIGAKLAPSDDWATVPVAAAIIGVVTGIWPVSKTTALVGRKTSFILFLWFGVGACLLAAIGIGQENFYLFTAGLFLFGFSSASTQQFRYAAIECLGSEKAATAASIILSGGIVAAFIGPELAVMGKDFTVTEYQGSFWMAAICLIVASLLIFVFKTAPIQTEEKVLTSRPFREIINPGLCLAICSGATSYFVMSLIMTATPISMHHYFMHSLVDTKLVIQSHIAAMFLPSLVSPLFFRWFGILNMMKIGLATYCVTIILGQFFTSVLGFWVQLVLLGVGWNFLFVAGTALLSQSYRSEDRLKAQAVNDGLMFGMQAISAIGAGMVMARVSWAALVSIGVIPMFLMLGFMYWYYLNKPEKTINY